MKRLLITANSPGEMAGWVKPLTRAWASHGLGPVDLMLLPCTFATGQEERVARSLPGIDRIYKPWEYAKLFFRDGKDYREGGVLHLGGDLFYTTFLSWRWGLQQRTWSYLWARPFWDTAFQGYFTKDDWGVNWLLKRRIAPSKIHLVGDLVLDSVRQHVSEPVLDRANQISYLPGSRETEVRTLAPFFLKLHALLEKQRPGLRGVLHLSPFLPEDASSRLLEGSPHPKVGGHRGRLDGNRLVGPESELEIATTNGYQRLAESRLAVSIPGTKTAEAGYLRTPVYTLIPLNRPEELPSIGLVGLLDWLPGGSRLKGHLMLRLKGKLGLIAHPNMKAGRALLPEFVDVVEAGDLAGRIGPILNDESLLRSVQEALVDLYSWEPEPAEQIVTMLSPGPLGGRSS